jgi:hypothetical protein
MFPGALALLLLGLFPSCRRPEAGAPPPVAGATPISATPESVRFTDVARESGIRFRHTNGSSGRLYFPETVGAGGAFLDYDNDGRLDIYLVNSSRLPGFTGEGPFYPGLYRNQGGGRFEDVTRPSGLTFEIYGMGVAVGDYDNDGWADLYVSALEGGRLLHNEARAGRRVYVDVTEAAGLRTSDWGTSCAWVDFDRDGWLDLFVCNYAVWSPETNRVCRERQGQKHLCGPRYYPGSSSRLYRNRDGKQFEDVTSAAGICHPAGKSLGVAICDDNGDGWPDLFVANDAEPNLLFRNNRQGGFSEVGVEAGVAYGPTGQARAGMGVDSGDDRNQGIESLVIGNIDGESHALFRPATDGATGSAPYYQDVAASAGIAAVSRPYSTFGAVFCDLDMDGWKDILTANGHVDPQIALGGRSVTFEEPLLLFRNDGTGQYHEIGRSAGPAFAIPRVHRGIAVGDYDGDGDPDLLVTVCNGAPVLLRQEGSRNHWLWVDPIGVTSNRDALGTRVRVVAGGIRQTGWVRSGSSYCSASDSKAFFGLGAADVAESVEIFWPGGGVDLLTNVPADQVLRVREGSARGRSGR